MKYLRFFLILLLIPFMVLAEECDVSKITITSMKPNKIEGNTKVISEPTFEDRTINLNLKMYDVNDSITYDLVIKNDSEEDYMIDEDTFKTDSDYIEYSLKTKDNTNVVKANSTKEVSLIVTYKKEIEDDKLTNNKFNASNSLKLSLNTSEKEQPLDIITTDNIKESLDPGEVKNPITSVSSMMLISIILLTSTVIIYILLKRKNKYTKYLLILLSMILIPTVYAICKCDIEVESTIEIEKKANIYDIVVGLSNENNNYCVTKYNGKVTDEVGKTVSATKVYFANCNNQRNVIFGGFCWQVIRTTETGGVKMIYNGEPVDGKCESTRGSHYGIVSTIPDNKSLSVEHLYGSSFTYDTETKKFTLQDTETATWSDSTYESLLGKYTCFNDTGVCSVITSLNTFVSNTAAYKSDYSIRETNYAQIGTSSISKNKNSPAMVGYMYNKIYEYKEKNINTEVYKYGNSFTYDESTNTYTLSGTTQTIGAGQTISSWNTGYKEINNTHYTCWNTTGKCQTISYIYFATTGSAYYIQLSNGKSVDEAFNEMLYNDDVNRYSSSIKGIIDAWFGQNLSNYTDRIEDAIYCNARGVENREGWNSNGGRVNYWIEFKNYNPTNDLSCENITDQFAVSNNKAKLKYPVALLEDEERTNIYTPSLFETGNDWWTLSPSNYSNTTTNLNKIERGGTRRNSYVTYEYGIRPVISLNELNIVKSGIGSETDPWIIE